MNKKLTLTALSLLLLAGCANSSTETPKDDSAKEDKTTETTTEKKELNGTAAYDNGGTVNATIVKDGDQLSDVMMEFVDQDGNAITELEQLYGPDKDTQMSIDTDWLDQVEYVENFIKENGVDAVTVDENGKPTNPELKDVVDLDIRPMLVATQDAIGSEKDD